MTEMSPDERRGLYVDLRVYFERIIRDMELRLQQRFDAQETGVKAALIAAEKAVEKSEAAQSRVNATQNEFRGTLSDQARELMPRAETESLVRELRNAISAIAGDISALRSRLDAGPEQDRFRKEMIRGFPPVVWLMGTGIVASVVLGIINLLAHH